MSEWDKYVDTARMDNSDKKTDAPTGTDSSAPAAKTFSLKDITQEASSPGTPQRPISPEDSQPGMTSATPDTQSSKPSAAPPGAGQQTPLPDRKTITAEVVPLSDHRPLVMDIKAGVTLIKDGRGEPLVDMTVLSGHILYLVDFPDSSDLDLIDINGPAKYAKVLARKKLEERGEVGSDGLFWPYDVTHDRKDQSTIFYQIFPKRRFDALFDSMSSHPGGYVVHDTVSFLWGLLAAQSNAADNILAMHLPDSIVVVAGRGRRVKLARRYSLMGNDEDSLRGALKALDSELLMAGQVQGLAATQIQWLTAFSKSPKTPVPDTRLSINPWPVAIIATSDGPAYSSLPLVLDKVHDRFSLGPKEELWLRPLERAESWLYKALAVLVLFFILGSVLLWNANTRIASQKETIQEDISRTELEVAVLSKAAPPADFKNSLTLARDLDAVISGPSLGGLWNEISLLKPRFCRVDSLNMAVQNSSVSVTLGGEMELDIAQAQEAFAVFLADLEKKGFAVNQQILSLDVGGNSYSLTISRPIQVGGRP